MLKIDERNLSQESKEKILKLHNYICGYCSSEAEQVDHILPWSFVRSNNEDNLIACCWLCNAIAGNNVFETFRDKLEFIQKRRHKLLKQQIIAIWTKKELRSLGYSLKQKIINSSLIVGSDEEARRIRDKLTKEGWRVATKSL